MDISQASQGLPFGKDPCGAVTSRPTDAGVLALGDVRTLPLLDPVVLQDLEDELGRPDLAAGFAKDYVGLWEQRERRLSASLAEEDLEAALDSAISLKVSSSMVGARRLASLAQVLESAVRGGELSGGPVRELISVHGKATMEELRAQYLQRRG